VAPRKKSTRNVSTSLNPQDVGDRLENIRLSKGLSIVEFTKRMGIPKMTYYNYVNGVFLPRADILGKLNQTYGISVDYILFGKKKKKLDTASDAA